MTKTPQIPNAKKREVKGAVMSQLEWEKTGLGHGVYKTPYTKKYRPIKNRGLKTQKEKPKRKRNGKKLLNGQ